MANQLREIGEFVVFENPQLHELQEAGLMVAHQSATYADLQEIGLMVVHDAQDPTPSARLIEIGLMVLHSSPPAESNTQKLQSFILTNFSNRQGSNLKKTSGQIS